MTTSHGGPSYPLQFLTFAEHFEYDSLNRLISASDTGGWTRQFEYDRYGNQWVAAASGVPASGQSPSSSSFIDPASNRVLGATSYDAAGNQTRVLNSSQTLSYDTENHVTRVVDSATAGGGQVNYVYDGEGRRVQKIFSDGATQTYVYDIFGQLIAEYSSNPDTSASPCQTCYVSADHLGSTRFVTGDNAAIISRHDCLPFGEEIFAGFASRRSEWGAPDKVNQKFTGQERDAETQMDFFQARYFSAAQGRFTSADPMNAGADPSDPQSWNGYAYVGNNPLARIDPTGMSWWSDLWNGITNVFTGGCGSTFCITATGIADIS